jgi:nucleoside-diphosphate-sugar epimerase
MKILVTGGFGFLGSHLVDILTKIHHKDSIHIVDDLSSNVVNPVIFSANKPNLSYTLSSVETFFAMIKDRDPYKFDQVYHLASIVGPGGVLPFTGRIAKHIIDDSYLAANYCKRNNSRLVFVSTSEVYGGGQDGYCSEEMPCIITPDSSARLEYAIGKLASEISIINQVKAHELKAVIVRPFNIAGARQSGQGGFVLPRFIKACQDNKPITVFEDGSQVRAFTDARDVSMGLYKAMQKGLAGEIYNLGSEENRISIKEFAELVRQIYGSQNVINYVDPKDIFGPAYAEANDKYPNSEKARAELGWRPQYKLEDIIRSAIEDRAKR